MDSIEHLAGRLESEGRKTAAFFAALSPPQWDLVIYSEGGEWTLRQICAHIVATEMGIGELIADILRGGSGAPEGFDIDGHNAKTVAARAGLSIESLLAEFTALRQQNVARVQGMAPADLNRRGRHPYLGMTDLSDTIKLLYRHNQIHLRDAAQVMRRR